MEVALAFSLSQAGKQTSNQVPKICFGEALNILGTTKHIAMIETCAFNFQRSQVPMGFFGPTRGANFFQFSLRMGSLTTLTMEWGHPNITATPGQKMGSIAPVVCELRPIEVEK